MASLLRSVEATLNEGNFSDEETRWIEALLAQARHAHVYKHEAEKLFSMTKVGFHLRHSPDFAFFPWFLY